MNLYYSVYSIDSDSGAAEDVCYTGDIGEAMKAYNEEVARLKAEGLDVDVTVYLYDTVLGNMLEEQTILATN